MQVKLITTIETIIDCDPEHRATYKQTKDEIFGRFIGYTEDDDLAEDIKGQHSAAAVFDTVRAQSVTHSFEEVK